MPHTLNEGNPMMHHNSLDRSALFISNLLCPPAVAGIGMILAAAMQPGPNCWGYAAAYILLAIGLPLIVLFRMLSRGRVSDLDVTQRHERLIPFITALGGQRQPAAISTTSKHLNCSCALPPPIWLS